METKEITTLSRLYHEISEKFAKGKLSADDGFSEADIALAEKKLGFRLPESLRLYYSLAGKLTINTVYNRLLSPGEIKIEDGYLLFMEENQEVVTWGIPLTMRENLDPVVWQRDNTSMEWHTESLPFSLFMFEYFSWLDRA